MIDWEELHESTHYRGWGGISSLGWFAIVCNKDKQIFVPSYRFKSEEFHTDLEPTRSLESAQWACEQQLIRMKQ